MKYSLIWLIFMIGLFGSCQQQTALQEELQQTQLQLDQALSQLEEAQASIEQLQSGNQGLVHLVFFKLKEGISEADKAQFVALIKGLEIIEQIQQLQMGGFEDLGDQRALSEYDLVLKTIFANEEDYRSYQNDERHINAREQAKAFMGGPPATYDYFALSDYPQ